MRIIVNHLTRMQPGFVCAAGIDVRSGRHVRPVLSNGRLQAELVRDNGGTLAIGALLDLGAAEPVGTQPEVEDHLFDPRQLTLVNEMQPDVFWQALERVAQPSLPMIFGDELQFRGSSAVVDPYHGSASLGCLYLEAPIDLAINHGRVRARFQVGDQWLDLSVTDLRLHDAAYAPDAERVAGLARRLRRRGPAILSVGLTRPWQKSGDDVAYHWLQVNNIFPSDEQFV